jgi:ABC-type transport system involved in multi-copper enzyme maturation permease subunit
MISIHILKTIAGYEMRTLLRSWFFRIFAALAIFSLGIYNFAIFIDSSGVPWIFRALPAAIPYANLIILNLGQAIVAIFLASEFLKQDKKNDTVEVIYARSMTNTEYILGKTLGILIVFFVLNMILLLIGIGFSFMSKDSSHLTIEYLIYPFLISLPTLVFIIGLSFLLMVTIKNQAVTFILLLGYVALSVFYLNSQSYHLFDFIAYNVPMMHSTISGFGHFNEILIHRGIYFFLGLGLIFFTVFKLARLPQARKFQSLPLYISCAFLSVGLFLMYQFIRIKEDKLEMQKTMISINNFYSDYPKAKVDSCDLKLKHLGKEIEVTCSLRISNPTNSRLDTLIFSLNPSLEIRSLRFDGENARYDRKLQVIKISLSKALKAGESMDLEFRYRGEIDENVHFLDRNFANYNENFRGQIYPFRKHYAYLQDNFVCLTSESLWYPVSGVGFASKKPDVCLHDFTNYTLEVNTSEKLMALSQGAMLNPSKGKYFFKPEYPLTKLSLLIGDYRKISVEVDSVEYGIYVREGNQYFIEHFKELKDSLPLLIRELRNEYEAFIGFRYPFKRFIFAEVPVEYAMDKHNWSVASEAVQPEMIFINEKAIFLNESDFKRRKNREEKMMKGDNEEVLPDELEARIFKTFMRNNFMANPDQWFQFRMIDRNTLSIFPEFFTYSVQLRSDKWPILNTALEAYIKERNVSSFSEKWWWFQDIDKTDKINIEMKQASLSDLIKRGVSKIEDIDEDEGEGGLSLNELIMAKGNHLFSLFKARYGEQKFNQVLDAFIEKNKHQSFSFEELDSMFSQSFGLSIQNEVNEWYNTTRLPGFLIKDLETYRVKENEYTKYQLRFKVSNPEPVDGLLTVYVEMGDQENSRGRDKVNQADVDFSKNIYLPANTSKEIGLVFPTEPARMRIYTHISQNLPNNIIYDFGSFEELRRTEAIDSVKNTLFFKNLDLPDEFIVDNEDSGFEIIQASNESYLKSIIKKIRKNQERYPYSKIRTWGPPGTWESVLESGFYGKYIRSARYTKSGDGKRLAIWHANLEKSGNYDIYCHVLRITNEWQRRKERLNYNFRIYHDGGSDEVKLFDEDIESGWIYLGTFFISPSNAKVELNNKSSGNMIIADAIKWVKSK